ncbi:MAG: cytochrome c oxidase subunit II [Halolamina sp.]
MHVHRFEKLWFGVSLVLIVAFIGTIVYGAVGPGIAMVDDSGGTVEPSVIADGDYEATENFREPGVYDSDEGVDVYVVARQYMFDPGTSEPIEVPAGEPVTFYVTTPDVTHGFNLVGTNVNSMVVPGQVAEFTVTFDEPGEHGIVCHEYCGDGHHTMEGQVVVVEESEFDGGDN